MNPPNIPNGINKRVETSVAMEGLDIKHPKKNPMEVEAAVSIMRIKTNQRNLSISAVNPIEK